MTTVVAAVALLVGAIVWRWQWVRARRVRARMLQRLRVWCGGSNG